jgi:Skp family chaperone for outer membrane proteins
MAFMVITTHKYGKRMWMAAVDHRSNRGPAANEKSPTSNKNTKQQSPSFGLIQALREMAQGWEGKIMPHSPQPPEDSPNHNTILRQLSAQVTGLHKEGEEQAAKSKQQLADTEIQLQELQQEYKTYRHEMSQRLQELGNSDVVALQDEYNRQIVDLQEQLLQQVETCQKKAAKAANLDRLLNEERRTVERLRHAIHDSRFKFDEVQQELENTISRLEKECTVTRAALQQATDLLTRREKQISILQSNSQSLGKLFGKMRRLLIQRTHHRLETIKTRILHLLQRLVPQRALPSTTTNKENHRMSVISKIKMMTIERRRRRHRTSSSISSGRSDKTSIARNNKDNRSF